MLPIRRLIHAAGAGKVRRVHRQFREIERKFRFEFLDDRFRHARIDADEVAIAGIDATNAGSAPPRRASGVRLMILFLRFSQRPVPKTYS